MWFGGEFQSKWLLLTLLLSYIVGSATLLQSLALLPGSSYSVTCHNDSADTLFHIAVNTVWWSLCFPFTKIPIKNICVRLSHPRLFRMAWFSWSHKVVLSLMCVLSPDIELGEAEAWNISRFCKSNLSTLFTSKSIPSESPCANNGSIFLWETGWLLPTLAASEKKLSSIHTTAVELVWGIWPSA